MKKFWTQKTPLQHELQSSRVKSSEIEELIAIADQLGHVELPKLSQAARQRIEEQTHKPSKAPRIAMWSVAGALAAITVVVISAQFAPESSPLYAIKQGTDEIRAFFMPEHSKEEIKAPKNSLQTVELHEVNPIAESPKSLKPEQSQPEQSRSHSTHGQAYDASRKSDNHDKQKNILGDEYKKLRDITRKLDLLSSRLFHN